jgi:hypothetical protein
LLAQNENGVSLMIRFADGTSRFHVGEIIPVARRTPSKAELIELRSNDLEFDVVAADAAWQQQTLSSYDEPFQPQESKTASA